MCALKQSKLRMMSHSLCHFLLLVFLFGRAVVLVKASEHEISCGYDVNCQALVKLMSIVKEMNDKLDKSISNSEVNEKLDKLAATVHEIHGKQGKDVEELKLNINKSLSSTAAISAQLERHSADLLRHDERLKANDVCPDVNEKFDKLISKQVKDVVELKAKLDRCLTSTAAINTQLERFSTDLLRHDERLKTHDVSQTNAYQLVKSIQCPQPKPRDCSDIRERGSSVSGVYRVDLGSDNRKIEVDVYCDFTSVGQSWLVFQRRKDGRVNFDRNWIDYANGFGVLTGEFWLGNEKLSLLTTRKKYKLRIELEDFLGGKRWAEYSTFSVRPSTDKYRLTVAGYSGNAGDSFTHHNNMMFSTKDADNDLRNDLHCSQLLQGGWWFYACHYSNLNGLYLGGSNAKTFHGIYWYHWKGTTHSLKATEMKIAAVE